MNHTTNYQLSQRVKSDRVKMEDFNADNAKIDGALASHAATLASLTEAMPKLGNCAVYAGTYIGTGDYNPVVRTFPARPVFIGVNYGPRIFMDCITVSKERAANRYADFDTQ